MRWREIALAGLLVACLPFVLLAFNRDWLITPDGFLDAWHYVGLFHDYLNPNFSPGAYKLGRLPWILSGFLAQKTLSPVWAAYVLHGSYFFVTTLALFAALYLMLRRLALAAVVATLFGFFTVEHGSGGWDYHNTAAGPFYLLAVALLAWPAVVAGRTLPLILTGAVIALAVHSNIMLVNFLPVLAFVHLTIVRSQVGEWPRIRTLVARVGWTLVGAVLVTVILGLINWKAGREFVFFQSLVSMVMNMLSDPDRYQASNVKPWSSGWVWTARYLSLPAAVWLASVGTLTLRRSVLATPANRVARGLVLQFVLMAVVFVAWQAAGQTALDWDVTAYPLSLAALLALGALLADRWPETCEKRWLMATIGTAAVSVIFLSGVLGPAVKLIKQPAAPFISIAGAMVFLSGLLLYVVRPRVATLAVFVVAFGLGNSILTLSDKYYATDPCKTQPEIYEAIIDAGSWLGTLDPTYKRVRTWFDETEQLEPPNRCSVSMGRVGRSITSMAFVPYVISPLPVPPVDKVPENAVRQLASNLSIFTLISSRAEPLERWSTRLDSLGLSHDEVARHRVPLLGSSFTMYAWRIAQRIPTDLSFGPSIMTITRDTTRGVNVYGTPKGGISANGDRLEFKPTDARDHVAYPFVQLPRQTRDSWARVVVDSPETSPSCQLFVQAKDFTVLGRFECSSGTRYVRVPSTARGVRVYLADPSRRPFVLPSTIDVALSVSGP